MVINKTGSILIWSIFLVIFVTFSFLYISTGISKQIDANKIKIQDMNNTILIDNISTNNAESISLENNEKYIFQFYNSFQWTLKKDETLEFIFSQTNTGSIEIKNGGPLYYKVWNTSGIFSQGLIVDSLMGVTLSGNLLESKTLSLYNLWGFTEINIEFHTASGITFPYNYYKRIKNIGGIDIVKEFSIVE